MKTYIIAIGGIIILMVTWVFIQNWWRAAFANEITEDDVLAVRRSCGQCGCSMPCSKQTLEQKELNKIQ